MLQIIGTEKISCGKYYVTVSGDFHENDPYQGMKIPI